MIDKNGKLFGKINLIDLLIVLVIIALAIFIVVRFVSPKDDGPDLVPIKISMYSSEEPDFVVNHLKEGAPVKDGKEESIIGTLDSIEIGDPISYAENEDATAVIPAIKEDCNSVEIQILANGEINDFGANVNGVQYAVGHSLVVYAGNAKLYLRVSDIQPAA